VAVIEAGGGIGAVPDSVVAPASGLKFIPLRPARFVPLVLVWREDDDSPPVQRFRELLLEWKQRGRL